MITRLCFSQTNEKASLETYLKYVGSSKFVKHKLIIVAGYQVPLISQATLVSINSSIKCIGNP